MTRFMAAWDRYWFSTSDRYQYGIFRMLLVGGLFGLHLDEWSLNKLDFAAQAMREFTAPPALARWLHLPIPIPLGWVHPIDVGFKVLTVLAFVGLGTRLTLLALALLNLYIQSAFNSFGFIDHATTIPSLALCILAVTPGATRYSLDEVLVWLTRRVRPARGPLPVWPAELVFVVMALGYGSSGLAKVTKTSGRWLDGRTLAAYLSDPAGNELFLAPAVTPTEHWRRGIALESFVYSTGAPTPLGRRAAQHPWLMLLLSVASVLLELTFPLAIVFRRLRPYYMLGGTGFHISIIAMLRLLSFYSFIVCYLLYVDWDALVSHIMPGTSRVATA
jgi:hypothetical protein